MRLRGDRTRRGDAPHPPRLRRRRARRRHGGLPRSGESRLELEHARARRRIRRRSDCRQPPLRPGPQRLRHEPRCGRDPPRIRRLGGLTWGDAAGRARRIRRRQRCPPPDEPASAGTGSRLGGGPGCERCGAGTRRYRPHQRPRHGHTGRRPSRTRSLRLRPGGGWTNDPDLGHEIDDGAPPRRIGGRRGDHRDPDDA